MWMCRSGPTTGSVSANRVGKVESIGRFASRDKDARAPYKPLLLLWLIGRLAGGRPTRVSFSEAELDLKLLMHRYRLGRSVRVGFPCERSAGVAIGDQWNSRRVVWRVEDSNGNDVAKMPHESKDSPIVSWRVRRRLFLTRGRRVQDDEEGFVGTAPCE